MCAATATVLTTDNSGADRLRLIALENGRRRRRQAVVAFDVASAVFIVDVFNERPGSVSSVVEVSSLIPKSRVLSHFYSLGWNFKQ